jgi:hypothetical protein
LVVPVLGILFRVHIRRIIRHWKIMTTSHAINFALSFDEWLSRATADTQPRFAPVPSDYGISDEHGRIIRGHVQGYRSEKARQKPQVETAMRPEREL